PASSPPSLHDALPISEPDGDLVQGVPGYAEGEGVGGHWSAWSWSSRCRACRCPASVPCHTATTAPHVARRLGWYPTRAMRPERRSEEHTSELQSRFDL